MWRLLWFLLGTVRLRLTGASPQWALNALAKRRVAFREPKRVDDFTLELTLLTRDLPQAQAAIQKAMCDGQVLAEDGFSVRFSGLLKRPAFLIGLALCVFAAAVLPRFVLFYQVEGNETVPSQQILRELRELGVGFGTYGPSIKPQNLKNQMLIRIPKLQWFTVTQNGCLAKVVVRERPEQPPILDRKTPRNIIASRGGLLTRVTVLNGNSLCKVGDVVEKGQLLVSPYTDMQFKTQVSGALAEVYAQTWRRKTAVLPLEVTQKQANGKTGTALRLLLGQKSLNIFSNTGNLEPNCDKITLTYTLTLPGGYAFPLALELSRYEGYTPMAVSAEPETLRPLLESSILEDAKADMVAGEIVNSRFSLEQQENCVRVSGVLECEEMIARVRPAAILRNDADASDRKNH